MKQRVLCFLLAIAMILECSTSVEAKATKKQVQQEVSKLEKEVNDLQKKYNKKIKGADHIELGSVISRNPYIVKSPSFFGGNTYYWVTNTEDACDIFGYFNGYLKPTGNYRTVSINYQTLTCVEAKYIDVSKESKALTTKKNKLKKLKHTIEDYVKLEGMTLGVGESSYIDYSWAYGGKDNTISWSSSNKKIVTISKSGKVTAKKAGTVTITAKASLSGKKSSCKVKVILRATDIILEQTEQTLKLGDKLQLQASLLPSNASDKIKYKTSDEEIATVSSKGLIKTVGIGTAIITAYTTNGLKATCKIIVNNPVTNISFYKDNLTFGGYEYAELHISVSPEEYKDTFTVTSSNPNVLEFKELIEDPNNYGNLLLDLKVNSVGSANITIESSSGTKASCTLTVTHLSNVDVTDDEYAASWFDDLYSNNSNNDSSYSNDYENSEEDEYDYWY